MHQESSRVNKKVNVQKAFGIVGGATTGYTANPMSGIRTTTIYGAISNTIKPTFHTTTGKDGLPKVEVKNQREWINTLDSIKGTNEKRGGI